MITILDVARRARVTMATVSNVITDKNTRMYSTGYQEIGVSSKRGGTRVSTAH